ncbi:3-deoxy-7-phosphoheptulonate synthase [Salinispira pacifica]|uniref:Phospho-2-dehydro-3-deoxyheptonate aldolase n=1 Tax=Salinispira pacifica TaxID=1307761 RepID=V5WKR6_9SPIO|nr:3-deoxy-7-phosphoheptulonate synthase [Salinispira pacifica]AHC15786.1 2-keto-3-deoxy-D-arabino-heptulosonate-7- phosphate synthase I alpha [Salinispira pacifica]
MERTSNLRIESSDQLLTPRELLSELPATEEHLQTVEEGRKQIEDILSGRDNRLLGVIGPCSIHDPVMGLEYAAKLKELADEVRDSIYLVMRVYFEKPRTKLGWRGLILDPHLNGSNDIQEGLRQARKLLLDITAMGIPAGSEMLDPIVPQFIDDLLSWGAIGARTTESQTHREMSSGLSMPIGFKNGTDGSVSTAVNAMTSSRHPHSFIGIDEDGKTCILRTKGNDMGHLILRGGKNGPNYYRDHVESAGSQLREAGLIDKIMIDCSHSNSGKNHERQHIVLEDLVRQRLNGVHEVMGFMIESNHFSGKQAIPEDISQLKYGVSITDACIGWDETKSILHKSAEMLRSGKLSLQR